MAKKPQGSREEWEPTKPKEKVRPGMFPLGTESREEWDSQENPGIQPNFPASTDDIGPDILKPVVADTRTTGLRKGGLVRKAKKVTWKRWGQR
jgi:hypothetical protein